MECALACIPLANAAPCQITLLCIRRNEALSTTYPPGVSELWWHNFITLSIDPGPRLWCWMKQNMFAFLILSPRSQIISQYRTQHSPPAPEWLWLDALNCGVIVIYNHLCCYYPFCRSSVARAPPVEWLSGQQCCACINSSQGWLCVKLWMLLTGLYWKTAWMLNRLFSA